ncbi:MAG TPA: hypothetical protein VIH69_05625, partial [Dehalococcoidia bacterium]
SASGSDGNASVHPEGTGVTDRMTFCRLEKCPRYGISSTNRHRACYYGDWRDLCWRGRFDLLRVLLRRNAYK